MTKQLPTGCIKQSADIRWRTFNLLLKKLSFDDQTGHLYVADIEFDHTKATKDKLLTMKFIHQLLKNKKLLIRVKGRSINCLNNIHNIKRKCTNI